MNNESKRYSELGEMSFQGTLQKDKKNSNANCKELFLKIGILAIALVIIALVMINLIKLLGNQESNQESNDGREDSSKYVSVAEDFAENLFGSFCKGKKINVKNLKKQYPKFMDDAVEEVCINMNEEIENYFLNDEGQELFKKVSFKVKVVDKEKMESDELEGYQEIIEDFAGADKNVKVTGGYRVTIEVTVKNTAESLSMDLEFIVLKCNEKIGVWGVSAEEWGMDEEFIWDF